MKLFGEQGIQLQAGFGYGARWAAPESTRNSRKWTDWHRAMPNLDAWRKYVSTTAARYRESIRYWEVWNEPDLYSFAHFGAEDYAKLLKSAWEEVKKVNPRAIVMNGGFASVRPMGNPKKDNVQFQKEILRNCRGYYDLHAHHEHSNFPVYASVIDSLLLPMRKETGADAVPWYANETAISSASSGENMQALTLFKKLIFSWSRGAVGYTWYDLRNDGCDPYNAEHHYGMMTLDFHPKPIYPVYNALAAVYGKPVSWNSGRSAGIFICSSSVAERICSPPPGMNRTTPRTCRSFSRQMRKPPNRSTSWEIQRLSNSATAPEFLPSGQSLQLCD
ncbi:MAG: hypothetical protein L6W00_15805 [Lentisphaeria bacterium]|nr:MAG: hypothetical protein L6W00_15805 [Lentisphaeria bacterium]